MFVLQGLESVVVMGELVVIASGLYKDMKDALSECLLCGEYVVIANEVYKEM